MYKRQSQSSLSNWSGFLGLGIQPTDTWKFGYQLSTGYRIPTATELYFSFTNAYGTWKSNPGLKSERSINHTLFAKAQNEKGMLDINLYQTRYRNFLFEDVYKRQPVYHHLLFHHRYDIDMPAR